MLNFINEVASVGIVCSGVSNGIPVVESDNDIANAIYAAQEKPLSSKECNHYRNS